jgi:hypothetical protein
MQRWLNDAIKNLDALWTQQGTNQRDNFVCSLFSSAPEGTLETDLKTVPAVCTNGVNNYHGEKPSQVLPKAYPYFFTNAGFASLQLTMGNN